MNPLSTKLKTGIIVAVVFVIGAVVAIFKGGVTASSTVTTTPTDNSNTQVAQPATSAPDASSGVATSAPGRSTYKDGTYSADGNYNSPGGPDSISVTLTLKNDIVTDANVMPHPGDGTSARYQSMFVSGYKQYVIGKDISSLNLTKVSGSSLTPIGFDQALVQIKAQAKV